MLWVKEQSATTDGYGVPTEWRLIWGTMTREWEGESWTQTGQQRNTHSCSCPALPLPTNGCEDIEQPTCVWTQGHLGPIWGELWLKISVELQQYVRVCVPEDGDNHQQHDNSIVVFSMDSVSSMSLIRTLTFMSVFFFNRTVGNSFWMFIQ